MRWAFQYKLLLPFSFSLFLSWLFLLFIGIVLTLSSQIPHSVCFLICVSTFYHCASTSQTTAQHTVHIYYRCMVTVIGVTIFFTQLFYCFWCCCCYSDPLPCANRGPVCHLQAAKLHWQQQREAIPRLHRPQLPSGAGRVCICSGMWGPIHQLINKSINKSINLVIK